MTTLPAAITSDGNIKVFFAIAVADTGVPTVAECTAVTGFDFSCYATGDGFTPSSDESDVTDDRLCSTQTFMDIGKFTDKLAIKYVYRQQTPNAADNKAFKVLKRGTVGFFIVRWGIAFGPDLAAGDIVDVYPIVCGVQQKQPRADNEKLKIMQNIPVTGPVMRDVAVVA